MQKYIFFPLLLVVAVLGFFIYGETSFVDAISVPTPALRSPANQSNPVIPASGVITLDWNAVQVSGFGSVEKYLLEVKREVIEKNQNGIYGIKSPTDDFSFLIHNPTTEFSLSASNLGKEFSHGEVHRWRVKACLTDCSSANVSEWTTWRTFIPKFERPNLIQPVDNKLVLFSPASPMLFKWEESPLASIYRFILTGEDISPIVSESSAIEKELSFVYSGFAQNFFSWTATPLINSENDEFLSALNNLFPNDNIPSNSVSSSESFLLRFMPPNNPSAPENEIGTIGGVPSQITLTWEAILESKISVQYQVKTPSGEEVFVPSNENSITVTQEFEICEPYTWEVRTCDRLGFNCGPYPSHSSIQGAYPLDHEIQAGPWEFMFVPEFDGPGFEVSFLSGGKVKITAMSGASNSPVNIYFGDGTELKNVVLAGDNLSREHTYSSSGTYTIRVERGSCATLFESEVDIDIDSPSINNFNVSPAYPAWVNVAVPDVTITWNVSDTGGSNIKQVEVWRADFADIGCNDTDKSKCAWGGALEIIGAPTNSNSWKCSNPGDCPTDNPSIGVYWYGIHVLDNSGNMTTEESPIKVQVDTTVPSCRISASPFEGYSQLSVDLTEDSGESHSKYYWKGDADEEPVVTEVNTINVTYSNTGSDTKYYFPELRVENEAGNVSQLCAGAVSVFGVSTPSTSTINQIPEINIVKLSHKTRIEEGVIITFNVYWRNNEGDNMKLYVCNTSSQSFLPQTQTLCSEGKTWCTSTTPASGTSISVNVVRCNYRVESQYDESTQSYYAFVCEEHGDCSSPKSGTFTVLSKPASSSGATGPSDGTGSSGETGDGSQPGSTTSATPGICGPYCASLGTDNEEESPPGTTCICNPLGTLKFSDIINRILGFIFNISIVLTPIIVIVAGVMFVTAAGDPARIARAKSILLYTAIGFVIILISRGLVTVIGGIIGL